MSQIYMPQLICDSLFETVLIEPAKHNDKLCMVSGFATSSMAKRHIDKIRKYLNKDIQVDLIVGMTPETGIGTSHHNIFKILTENNEVPFNCSYVEMTHPPVHSKMYVWLNNNEPQLSFSGSANYTQNAFFSPQKELLSQCNHEDAYRYFEELVPFTVDCSHIEAEAYCRDDIIVKREDSFVSKERNTLEVCEISLVSTRNKKIQDAAGLNWGQSHALKNPKNPRNKNDAYLAIPVKIRDGNFFPPMRQYFSVRTDDGYTITCVRAQANGKAIHTPNDNSELGIYFRARLGVESEKKIETSDLERYGRSTVTFVKLDEEDYYMDFSI